MNKRIVIPLSVAFMQVILAVSVLAETKADERIRELRDEMEAFFSNSNLEKISDDDFHQWYTRRIFDEADADGSGGLTLDEFEAAFRMRDWFSDYSKVLLCVAKAGFPVSFQCFRDNAEIDSLTDSLWQNFAFLDPKDPSSSQVEPIIRNMAKIEERERKAKEAREKGDTLMGAAWNNDEGLLIWSKDRKGKFDFDKPRLTLQVLREFTKAGETKRPASVSWAKNASSGSIVSIDGALRLDYHNPSWQDSYDFTPSAGIEVDRSGAGDSKIDTRKYIVQGDIATGWGWINFGPIVEENHVSQVDTLQGLVEWEMDFPRIPLIKEAFKSGFLSKAKPGVWNSLARSDDRRTVEYYYRPRIAIEPNTILSEPVGAMNNNWTLFRYGIEVGVSLWERIELTYEINQRQFIDDFGEDFPLQEATAKINLDKQKRLSAEISFKRGDENPVKLDIERYTFGLGLKF